MAVQGLKWQFMFEMGQLSPFGLIIKITRADPKNNRN